MLFKFTFASRLTAVVWHSHLRFRLCCRERGWKVHVFFSKIWAYNCSKINNSVAVWQRCCIHSWRRMSFATLLFASREATTRAIVLRCQWMRELLKYSVINFHFSRLMLHAAELLQNSCSHLFYAYFFLSRANLWLRTYLSRIIPLQQQQLYAMLVVSL